MTDLEQTILREIATLPKEYHSAVLAFVRYLKFTLADEKTQQDLLENPIKIKNFHPLTRDEAHER